jgi:hypothetical protein
MSADAVIFSIGLLVTLVTMGAVFVVGRSEED